MSLIGVAVIIDAVAIHSTFVNIPSHCRILSLALIVRYPVMDGSGSGDGGGDVVDSIICTMNRT